MIETDQCGLRIREAGVLFGMFNVVHEVHSTRGDLTYAAADANEIVVTRGLTVPHPQIGHDQPDPGRLKLAITEARLAQMLGPGNIQPDDVPCVIHDAHLVSLGVVDTYGGDGFNQGQVHRELGGGR